MHSRIAADEVNMVVFTALLSIVLTLFSYWCYGIYKINKQLQRIPGPPPIPFLGCKLPNDVYDLKIMFDDLFAKYGDIVKFYVGEDLNVLTRDAELFEALMKSTVHTKKSNLYQLTKDWLMGGLIVSHGDKWKQRRKLITPSFHFSMLKNFFPIFTKRSEILVEKLGEQADKRCLVDAIEFVSKFALDVIAESSLGLQMNVQEGEGQEYIQAVNNFMRIAIKRNFSIWQRFDLLFKLFAREYKFYKNEVALLNGTSSEIIKKKREEIKQSFEKVTSEEHKTKVNLIDALLQHPVLNNEDIQEEVNNFMFAGYDTTSTGISLMLYELSKRPKIQEKLYNEVKECTQNDPKNITQKTLQEMKYFDMVVKEVFRMRAPVPFIGRELVEDARLVDNVYPKGTAIVMSIYSLHRNPKYFPNPEVFDPERFSPDNPEKPPLFAYVPFSAGPRNCVGQKYAQLEMKTAITRILMNLRILPVVDDEMILGLSGILRSKHGFPIKLERRRIEEKM